MALSDYRLCDVCGRKAFYDSNLNYDDSSYSSPEAEPFRVAGAPNPHGPLHLDYLGDWGVLCRECAKTHRTQIVAITSEEPTHE